MFSKRIKELRIEKDVLQRDVANFLNISTSAYGFYEQGKRSPDSEIMKKISDYFNVSLDYLMGKSDIKESADNIIINSSNNTTKQKDKEIDTIAAHLEGKDITPHKMKMIKRYIDDLFEEFDD